MWEPITSEDETVASEDVTRGDDTQHENVADNAVDNDSDERDILSLIAEDEQMELETLEETMNVFAEENDSVVLDQEEANEDNNFFDNNDDDLLENLNTFENELHQQLYSTHENNNSNNMAHDSVDNDNNDEKKVSSSTESLPAQLNQRPRRMNAGAGREILEPTMGGKEHFSYRKKMFLQQQKQSIMTRRNRILLMMKGVRQKSNHPTSFFQMAVKTVFLSAQMSGEKGLKKFGQHAIAAIIKECTQLDKGAFPGKPVVEPIHSHELTKDERNRAMSAVVIIKEKRCGTIKARICANGSKQRKYLPSNESVP